MATDVQRRVIKWMADAGGEIVICTGFKKTRQATLRETGALCIATSVNVVDGLINNRLVEKSKPAEYGRSITYRLVEAGRVLAASRLYPHTIGVPAMENGNIRVKVTDGNGCVLQRHEIDGKSAAMRLWLADLFWAEFPKGNIVIAGPANYPDFAA